MVTSVGKTFRNDTGSGSGHDSGLSAQHHSQPPHPTTLLHADGAHSVVIPGGQFLLTAEFVRSGPDLILRGPQGSGGEVVVSGYFAGHGSPDLLTETGGVISADLAAKLAGPLAPGQFAQGGNGAPQLQAIGTADKIAGTVTVRHGNGTSEPLSQGGTVYQGDVLETGKDGSVGIIFADRTTFSLGKGGRMVMDDLVYDSQNHSGHSAFSVVQGTFSFVSGQIAKSGPDAMTVKTPVMTIGIRGTTVAGQASAEGEQNSVVLLQDPDGGVGQIVVSNQAGTQILTQTNQAIQLTSSFTPPPPPIILPPQQIQQLFAPALQFRPQQPATDPHINNAQPGQQGHEQGHDQGPAQHQAQGAPQGPGDLTHQMHDVLTAGPKGDSKGGDAAASSTTTTGTDQGTGTATTGTNFNPNFLVAISGTASGEVLNNPTTTSGTSTGSDHSTTGTTGSSSTGNNTGHVETPTTTIGTTGNTSNNNNSPNNTAGSGQIERDTSSSSSGPTVTYGHVVDGYVVGATVFQDTNNDGILDNGEVSRTTDSSTGVALPAGLMLKAPAGSVVITPVTSMIVALTDSAGSVAAAEALVKTLFGLPSGASLTSLDPAASASTSSDSLAILKAGAQIAATIEALHQAIQTAGGSNVSSADVFNALVAALPASGSFNLANTSNIISILNNVPGVDLSALAGSSTFLNAVAGANAAIGSASANGLAAAQLSLIDPNGSYGSELQTAASTHLAVDLHNAVDVAAHLGTLVPTHTSFTLTSGTGVLHAADVSALTHDATFISNGGVMELDGSAAQLGALTSHLHGISELVITSGGYADIAFTDMSALKVLEDAGADTIQLQLGSNALNTGLTEVLSGGSNTIINLDASGFTRALTVMGGSGNDTIRLADGYLASDSILGSGGADTLILSGTHALADSAFTNLRGLSNLTMGTSEVLTVGSQFLASGINRINGIASDVIILPTGWTQGTTYLGYTDYTNSTATLHIASTGPGVSLVGGGGTSDFTTATTLLVNLASNSAVVNGVTQSLSGHTNIIGSTSNDTFVGGGVLQNFTLAGNGGTDTLQYNAGGAVTVNLHSGTAVHDGGQAIDHFSGMTSLVGTGGADMLTMAGDTFGLTYNSANNQIIYSPVESAVTDVVTNFHFIVGGSGNDTFYGSNTGSHTFYGGGGTDILNYSSLSEAVTIDLTTSKAIHVYNSIFLTDALSGFTTFYGTEFNDTFISVFGAETFYGVDGAGNVLQLTANSQLFADSMFAHDHGIQQVALTGSGDTLILGSNAMTTGVTQALISNSGGGTIDASGFSSTLSLGGGTGNDRFIVNSANIDSESINGGTGTNTLEVTGTTAINGSGKVHAANMQTLQLDALSSIALDSGYAATGLTSVVAGLRTTDLTIDASSFGAALTLVGGSENDTFDVATSLIASGTINGGEGRNVLDLTGGTTILNSLFSHMSGISGIQADSATSLILGATAQSEGVTALELGNNSGTLTLDMTGYTTAGLSVHGGTGLDKVIVNGATLSNDTLVGNVSGTLHLKIADSASFHDSALAHVSNAAKIQFAGASEITLGANAQTAGISIIDLSPDTASSIVLDVSEYTTGATMTGSNGNDRFIITANSFTGGSIDGGSGTNVLEAQGTITLTNVEFGSLAHLQTLILDDSADRHSIVLSTNAAALAGVGGLSLMDASHNTGRLLVSVDDGFSPSSGIVTMIGGSGSNIVSADNVAELAHLKIDGGAGHTTLKLTAQGDNLTDADFSASHLANIDKIEVTGTLTSIVGGSNFNALGTTAKLDASAANDLTLDLHAVTNDVVLIGAQSDSSYGNGNTFYGGTGYNTFVAGIGTDVLVGNASALSNVAEYARAITWQELSSTDPLTQVMTDVLSHYTNIGTIMLADRTVGQTNSLEFGYSAMHLSSLPVIDASWSAADLNINNDTFVAPQGVYSIIGGSGNNVFTIQSHSLLSHGGNGFALDGGVGPSTLNLSAESPFVNVTDADFISVFHMDTLQVGGATAVLLGTNFSAAGFTTVDASNDAFFVTLDLSSVTAAGATTLIGSMTAMQGTGNTLIGSSDHALHGASDVYVVNTSVGVEDQIKNFSATTDHIFMSATVDSQLFPQVVFGFGDPSQMGGEQLSAGILQVGLGSDGFQGTVDLTDSSNNVTGFSSANIDLEITAVLDHTTDSLSITSGAGNDNIIWTAPDPNTTVFLDGGAGHNTLYLSGVNNGSIEIDLSATGNELVGTYFSQVSHFEAVDGSNLDNVITGSVDFYVHASSTDLTGHYMAAGLGYSSLEGGGGADTLVGSSSGDGAWATMIGGGGGDTIISSRGVSVIEFNAPVTAATGGPEHILNLDLSKDYLVLPSNLSATYGQLAGETRAVDQGTYQGLSHEAIHTTSTDLSGSGQSLGSGAGVVLFYNNTAHATEMWFTNNAANASTSNSYQIAQLDHVTAHDVVNNLNHVLLEAPAAPIP